MATIQVYSKYPQLLNQLDYAGNSPVHLAYSLGISYFFFIIIC
jgi:hypothetical protein